MQLDPPEEEFDLPTILVQGGNRQRRQGCIVGQKDERLMGLGVLKKDTSQIGGIVLRELVLIQLYSLISNHARGPSGGARIDTSGVHISFCSRDKKCASLMHLVESGEIQVAAVHQIERSRLEEYTVKNVDLVHLAVIDVDKREDLPSQIQQIMRLDGGLFGARRRPRMQRQAQVDGCGIEGLDGSVQIDVQGVLGIQGPGDGNQMLSEVLENLPRSFGDRVGQLVARNGLATKSHVVQPIGLIPQIDLEVAQGLLVFRLCKGYGEELVQGREVLDLVIATMPGHTPAKGAHGQIGQELGKHEFALVHTGPSRNSAKGH